MNRPVKGTLPTRKTHATIQAEITHERILDKQQQHLKETRRAIPDLKANDLARYYDTTAEIWRPCKLVRPSGEPRSWIIETSAGKRLRRTAEQLKTIPQEDTTDAVPEAPQEPRATKRQHDPPQDDDAEEEPPRTRTRTRTRTNIQRPARYR